jgi:hypothetical protein
VLILSATSENVSVVTDSTANLDIVTSFVDRNQSTGLVGLAQNQLTAITTAGSTVIVSAPPSATSRNIKEIHIRNKHTFSNNMVTVQLYANSVRYSLWRLNLLPGECLQYVDRIGFFKLPNITRFERTMVTAADQSFGTAATFADITGLTCPLLSGRTYCFMAHIVHLANATTTGAFFAVNIGATPTFLQVAAIDMVSAGIQNVTKSGGATQGLDAAIITQTTGAVAMVPALISGTIVPSADGTFAMRASSEVTVANGLVTKGGSWLRVWEPNF